MAVRQFRANGVSPLTSFSSYLEAWVTLFLTNGGLREHWVLG